MIFGEILNITGATARWIYGSIWRTIFKKSKYSYSEYLKGPKDSTNYYDKQGHRFNNKLIGIIIIVSIFSLIT